MSTLEDIKKVLSRDFCYWCKPRIEQAEDFFCPKGDRYSMCKAAKEARAEDVYERFVKPLEKNVNTLSDWAAEYANCGAEMKDAAEFEARVAVKLAINTTRNSQPCPYGNSRTCTCECDSKHRSCVDNRLKWARLAVEAEMDAEHGNEA